MEKIESRIILLSASLGDLPHIDTSLSLEILSIKTKKDLSIAKDFLQRFYHQSRKITVFNKDTSLEISLFALEEDFLPIDKIYIKGEKGYNKARYCFGDLLRIIARLTAKDGCPWDKEQTHESIRINMIEEAYEAVDAIDKKDWCAMQEELGDVMLQTVLHADIAQRNQAFTQEDITDRLCQKLVSRHTHIFGDDAAKNSSDALGFWEKAKGKEKSYNSLKEKLNSYPNTFSSLILAQKIFGRLYKEYELTKESTFKIFEKQIFEAMNIKESFALLIFLLTGIAHTNGLDGEIELRKLCKDIIEKLDTAKSIEDLFK